MTMLTYNNKVFVKDESIDDIKWNRDAIAKSANIQKTIIAPALGLASYLVKYPVSAVYFGYLSFKSISNLYNNANDELYNNKLEIFKTFLYGSLTLYSLYNFTNIDSNNDSASQIKNNLNSLLPSLALTIDYAYKTEANANSQINAYNDAIEELLAGNNNFILEY